MDFTNSDDDDEIGNFGLLPSFRPKKKKKKKASSNNATRRRVNNEKIQKNIANKCRYNDNLSNKVGRSKSINATTMADDISSSSGSSSDDEIALSDLAKPKSCRLTVVTPAPPPPPTPPPTQSMTASHHHVKPQQQQQQQQKQRSRVENSSNSSEQHTSSQQQPKKKLFFNGKRTKKRAKKKQFVAKTLRWSLRCHQTETARRRLLRRGARTHRVQDRQDRSTRAKECGRAQGHRRTSWWRLFWGGRR